MRAFSLRTRIKSGYLGLELAVGHSFLLEQHRPILTLHTFFQRYSGFLLLETYPTTSALVLTRTPLAGRALVERIPLQNGSEKSEVGRTTSA